MTTPNLNRRRFLGVAAAGGLTVAGLTTLTACGGDGGSAAKGGAKDSAKLKLPTYVAATVAKPDLAGNADGLDAAYLRYPKDLVKATKGKPGDGKPITALTETFTTPAPGMDKNQYWQELNKRLGSKLDMTIVDGNSTEYLDRFNTTIASGDIPDLVWFPPNQGIRRVPELMDAQFHDLTPYLSGDKVKKYPNLANLPTYAWKTAVINGRIAGVTVAYGRLGQVYLANTDFWKPVGGIGFDSAEDFLDKCKELLDRKKKRYPLEPAYVNHVGQFAQWHGAPNGWSEKDGKLTHMWETEEYAAGVALGVKAFKANLFWPDAKLPTLKDKVANGQVGAYVESYPGFLADMKTQPYPIEAIKPFAAKSGAQPSFSFGYGSVGYTAISKKVDKARIPTLLKVLDYMAAPMGTDERLFLDNGIEGTHYKRGKGGDIELTEKGTSEVLTTFQAISFLINGPQYIYMPGDAKKATYIHQLETELLKIARPSASTGYFSDTNVNKGAGASTKFNDEIVNIVSGRKPLSFLKTAIKDWQSTAGNGMRKEYEKAIADAE